MPLLLYVVLIQLDNRSNTCFFLFLGNHFKASLVEKVNRLKRGPPPLTLIHVANSQRA